MRNRQTHGIETATAIRGALDDLDDPLPDHRQAELREFGRAIAKRRAKGHEVAAIRRKLQASAAGHLRPAAAQVSGREREHIDDASYQSFRKALDRGLTELDQEQRLADFEHVAVTHEVGPYEARSPHSWVRDVLAHSDEMRTWLAPRSDGESDMSAGAVAERLRRHEADVVSALRRGTEYGKRVQRMLNETCRQEDAQLHERLAGEQLQAVMRGESRAFTSGGGATAAPTSGASVFVSPAFLIDSIWAPYRSPYRAFSDQLNKSIALPDYGLNVYVPAFTAGTTVTSQTEGAAVAEGSPTTTFTSSAIVTKAGQLTVSQQYLDRAGPGIEGDAVLYAQVRNQLDAQIDAFAIKQALAGAQTVVDNEAFTWDKASAVGGFFGDLRKAKNLLHDTAGIRLRATHCFGTGDFVDFLSAFADANGRPMFAPFLDADRTAIRAEGDSPVAEGYAGYDVVSLALFADDNVPTFGTTENTQVFVCRPETILLLEGAPIPYCLPPTIAQQLEAVLGVRAYVAAIARFREGVATITGTTYKASTFA